MVTINTTPLAKQYRSTARDIEKRLRSLGVVPVRTTVIEATGRKYLEWDKETATRVLDEYQRQRKAEQEAAERVRPRAIRAPSDIELKFAALLEEVQAMREEIAELRKIVSEKA